MGPPRWNHPDYLSQVDFVRLEKVPVRTFLESQDHQHDLIRELQLIDIGRGDGATGAVSQRLAELISDILARYDEVRSVTRRQVLAALERGESEMTLEVPVVPGMRSALEEWLSLLEEADRLSVAGELLLMAATPEVRRLRRWYVEELSRLLPAG
jgi:hypothetical protein